MKDIYHAKLNDEGRLTIPSACRKQIGLHPGQEVLLKVTAEGLFIYTQDQSVKRLQDWVAKTVPSDVSLVNEVVTERRQEVTKEANE